MTDPTSRRTTLSRRAMMQQLGLAVGCVAAALPAARVCGAAAPGHLDVKDPAAKALGYVEHAADVDIKKYPDYIKGNNCENCLQLTGTPGNNYRPCSLFPGKLVSVSGWCTAWTPEM
jgi:hypothetical protein